MKITKLMWCALCAAVLAVFFVGCNGLDPYSIHAPSDLQSKIDSIANAQKGTGDTTKLTITTTIVGAEDNSTVFWGAFSDCFSIPSNKLLHLEFVNYSSGANNYNNWDLDIANVVGHSTTDNSAYAEYFILRSDNFGWGNSDFNANLISIKENNGTINWNDFITTMNGAYVTMEIDHSATGNVFVTATSVGTNGITMVETYQQPVSATNDIVASLVCDGSHYSIKKAYLLPSKITTVADVNPVSIAVTGTPTFVEYGNKNFWGNGVATVTYADGSTKQADSTDLSFNLTSDSTTLGTKTIIVAYSKTKDGNATAKAVSTIYTFELKASVTSLQVTTLPTITTYYYYSGDSIIFNTTGLIVTATYSDNSTGVIPNSSLKFSKIKAAAGTQYDSIFYKGTTSTIKTTCPLTLVEGVSQVGNTDFSSGYYLVAANGALSADYAVASTAGSSKTITMYCYSDNLANYHSPFVVLRSTDETRYAEVRMDNWMNSGTSTETSDWNWATFASNISGSKIVITVTNNGNNTANVHYAVTYATGETHFQDYAGIAVTSSDLNFTIGTEEAYLVFVN